MHGIIRRPEQVGPVTALAFSPGESSLLMGQEDGNIWVWDMKSPLAELVPARAEKAAVTAVAVSPDGRTFATGTRVGGVDYKDMNDFRDLSPGINASAEVTGLAFSQDGRRLAISQSDGSLWIWPVGIPGAPRHGLSGACSPHHPRGGRVRRATLVTCGMDGVVRLWDWDMPSDLVATSYSLEEVIGFAGRATGRNMTRAEWGQYFPSGGQPARPSGPMRRM